MLAVALDLIVLQLLRNICKTRRSYNYTASYVQHGIETMTEIKIILTVHLPEVRVLWFLLVTRLL